jgi:hypothetical protein
MAIKFGIKNIWIEGDSTNDESQSTVLFEYKKADMQSSSNNDSYPLKIRRNTFSQTPISSLSHNSLLNNTNGIPSFLYGPSFIIAN